MEQVAPKAGEPGGGADVPLEQVRQITYNTIYANNVAVGSPNSALTTNHGVQPGDLPALIDALRGEGLPESDVEMIREEIEASGGEAPATRLQRVRDNLLSKGGEVIGGVSVSVLTALMKGYFGIE
ncbi:hypothetical protein [Hoyosella subflava]|uniref:Uncharacterized protein n=1 Tax=Hoyosella subflava (strain DSM 45089 / JCM 17490 / NBRC 109087 / DQS3-9A1) TaxID=443218 RepID=F6ESA5_HOYSD|nr:hypothetical protein [Hoyosella subflava]AEF43026.1 hypothetical protein AS9A_P10009 [Hoyosella subflava DQS3-9A1]